MPFERNVFINCPFDTEYVPLLKALVFSLLYLELEPHLSQTISSSNVRVTQIKQLIRACKFGVHDISRNRAMTSGELPRFNMPYELGLDIGASEYGNRQLRRKKILILDKEKYHYQSVLSDIAGQDIQSHQDDPRKLIIKVRNWISINTPDKVAYSPSEIWSGYNQFTDDLHRTLTPGYSPLDIEEMPIGDYIKFAKDWLRKFKGSH